MNAVVQYGLYLALLVALGWPLGKYMYKVMNGDRIFLSPVLRPVEKGVYRIMRIDENEDIQNSGTARPVYGQGADPRHDCSRHLGQCPVGYGGGHKPARIHDFIA